MNAKIIIMSDAYKVKLTDYMHHIFPQYSDSYIDFDVKEAIGDKKLGSKSFIVVNDKNEIVGCHLNFITKACIKGEENTIVWGHNTYLDEGYRRTMGMDLILEMAATKNGFGYGLTDINYKIQNLIKSNIFINGLRKYCIVNIWYIWWKLLKMTRKELHIPQSLPSHINYKTEKFYLCQNANEINIPDRGFWYKDICEIDFIRDQEFLNKRFFQNPVNKYYVYTNQDKNCYFAIRPILHQGILGIQVADVRYLPTQPKLAKIIYLAIERICSKIHAGTMLFTTSDRTIRTLYENNRLCKSYPVAFVCGKKNVSSADANIIVNAADSDDEFHK